MRRFEGQQTESIVVKGVRRIIGAQVIAAGFSTLLMQLVSGKEAAVSALVGGAVGVLTSWIYAKKMVAPQGSDEKKMVRAHYRAEAYKLIFTILLFTLVFTQFKDVRALPLFLGYGATLVIYWVALIFV